jgi:hypothetical protein
MTTFEMATPQLVDLQAAVEAVHARWFGGAAAVAGAILTTGAGASDDPGPVGMKVIEAACSGEQRAELFLQWWSGDYSAWDGDPSDGDWFGANEAAYQLIRLGLDGPNAAADLEQALRAGPWREKWDSPRPGTDDDGNPIRTTILGLLIGKALKRQRQRLEAVGRIQFRQAGSDAVDEEAAPVPVAPTIETCEDKVARLERELAEERRAHAQSRTLIATQQTIIRAHNRVEAGLRAEVERLNRAKCTTLRIRRSKLKSNQVDGILTMTRLAAERSDYFDTDTPIITGEQLAKEIRVSNDTARGIAELVCSLPGAPIKRVTKYRDDGKRGKLTYYQPETRDEIALLEKWVTVVEALDRPKATRPRETCCPEHPKARVDVFKQHECSVCHRVLASDFPDARPLYAEIPRIAPEPPATVDVPVLNSVQNPRIAATLEAPETAGERAAAMVAAGADRPVDPYKRVSTRAPIDFEACREARARLAWEDPPAWLDEWQDHDQEQPPPRCIRPGCPEPLAPGNRAQCAAHQRESDAVYPAMAGGSE